MFYDNVTGLVAGERPQDDTFRYIGNSDSPSTGAVSAIDLILPPWSGDSLVAGKPAVLSPGSRTGNDDSLISSRSMQHL